MKFSVGSSYFSFLKDVVDEPDFKSAQLKSTYSRFRGYTGVKWCYVSVFGWDGMSSDVLNPPDESSDHVTVSSQNLDHDKSLFQASLEDQWGVSPPQQVQFWFGARM